MAKNKEFEKAYKAEYKRRTTVRAAIRMNKWRKHALLKQAVADGMCPYCHEMEYCYCGSRTPGVIDY